MTVVRRMHRNRPSDICQGTMLSMHDTTYFHPSICRFLFGKSRNGQNCYCFLALCCFAYKCIESLLHLAARRPRVLVNMKEKNLWRSINLGGLGVQEVKVVHDEDVSLLWAKGLNIRIVVARALQNRSIEITSVEVFAIAFNNLAKAGPAVAGVHCTQLYVHALRMLAVLADRPARLPSRPTNVSFCLTLSLRRFPKKVTLYQWVAVHPLLLF